MPPDRFSKLRLAAADHPTAGAGHLVPLEAADLLYLLECHDALLELDNLDPNEFKTDEHLPPAFREVNFMEAFRRVCRVVNRVLHNTDEYNRPLAHATEG